MQDPHFRRPFDEVGGITTDAHLHDAPSPSVGIEPAPSILLVEDEAIIAQDLQETLVKLGYRVVGIASEGVQAVCMAEEMQPNLIVMDVGLHGEVDGIQAARMIVERFHIPVIFLTGHRDIETLQRAVSTGPLGYILKPFQEVELRSAIEVAIHKHRADVALLEREEALRRNAELLKSLSLVDELTQLNNRRARPFEKLQHGVGIHALEVDDAHPPVHPVRRVPRDLSGDL